VTRLPPDDPDPIRSGTRIGTDDWVAQVEEQVARPAGIGRVWWEVRRLPPPGAFALLVAVSAVYPFLPPVASSDYLVRVGMNTLLFALLALGLNVTVGFAGLLDLGYVAFYGFGAYAYAILSSRQLGLHLPAEQSIVPIVVASALLGLLLGLPSRRLLGDYLAIVTLFFAQIFVLVVNNANRITPPWRSTPIDFTGGPNGIAGVDQLDFFGIRLSTVRDYYFYALIAFAIVIVALYFVHESRTGRAWRATREDPLAAQLMGMPVNRLKLMAFAFGAGIAGFTGTTFAALQRGVFPTNFDLSLLIIVYAMVILGGAGSLVGVVLGAVVVNAALEILRTPENARLLLYVLVVAGLAVRLRPWWRSATVLAGTLAFGLAVHATVTAFWP
jgi:branched-chain amino acid transport system permease protein